MTQGHSTDSAVGRARAVLSFGHGTEAVAVPVWITVRTRSAACTGVSRLDFRGPARFDPAAVDHIANVVLPIVDDIRRGLRIRRRRFEVGICNIGAASSQDVGLEITGFSADVPVFLALLSAVTAIPLPSGLVCTGHIASPSGEIRMVRDLPAKLQAAHEARGIDTFVLPSLEDDVSLQKLTPGALKYQISGNS